MADVNFPIDFVISWVDQNDEKWRIKKNNFFNSKINNNRVDSEENRYKDWGFFKYLFRSIEKNAAWVNHIYVITDAQCPEFLNTSADKVTLVDHKDYIPEEYLPTFNSSVIELYLNLIPNLSEHFVYFNDDMFINAKVEPSDFFNADGLPKDTFISSMLQPKFSSYFEVNNVRVINSYFNKHDIIRERPNLFFNWRFGFTNLFKSCLTLPFHDWSAFKNLHLPYSLRKKDFEMLEQYAKKQLIATSNNKFRGENDINIWLLQELRYCLGYFSPRSYKIGKYFDFNDTSSMIKIMKKENKKLIVINDNFNDTPAKQNLLAKSIIDVFENKFPNKSKFEQSNN